MDPLIYFRRIDGSSSPRRNGVGVDERISLTIYPPTKKKQTSHSNNSSRPQTGHEHFPSIKKKKEDDNLSSSSDDMDDVELDANVNEILHPTTALNLVRNDGGSQRRRSGAVMVDGDEKELQFAATKETPARSHVTAATATTDASASSPYRISNVRASGNHGHGEEEPDMTIATATAPTLRYPSNRLTLEHASLMASTVAAATAQQHSYPLPVTTSTTSTISNLNIPPANAKHVALYDREKEMRILMDEYQNMVQRAKRLRHADTLMVRNRNNLTSVICIAGKAGMGKTALVRSFCQAQMANNNNNDDAAAHRHTSSSGSSVRSEISSSSSQFRPRDGYFLYGKFQWPSTSITSTFPACPSYQAAGEHNNGYSASCSSSRMSLLELEQEQQQHHHHEPFAAFGMILDHLLEQVQARGPVASTRMKQRMIQAIGNPATAASSIAMLSELSPSLADFLQNQTATTTPEEHSGAVSVSSEMTGGHHSQNDDHDHSDNNGDGDHHGQRRSPPPPPQQQQQHSHGTSTKEPPSVVTANSNYTTSTCHKSTEKKFLANNQGIRVEHQMTRLKYILRQLFRAVCDRKSPCLVVFDDAQWASTEDLQLARHLHADVENPFFMLVLTWRTNDVAEEESCYTAMGSSVGIFANDLVRRINLQNLSLEATSLMVAEALQMPASDVTDLSKSVLSKTFGNPFFIRQFLEFLEQEGLLSWIHAQNTWRWDGARIAALDTSLNFVDLVSLKLRRLPARSLVTLQILSCLGPAFEEESAAFVLDKLDTVEMFDCDINKATAMSCIDSLVREGYLDRHHDSSSGFSLQTTFAHDQIQEAAFQLIPKAMRPLLQLKIGERLLETMEEQESEGGISYLGVDLCSQGIPFLSTKERMGLALYNLLAGEKCMARASFATALAYFELGLSALRVSDFLKGRLELELSFGAMESSFCTDDFEKVRLHYDRITSSALTPDDKIRAHVLLIRATGTRGDTKEAMATGYRVLRSIGVKSMMEMSNNVSLYVHLRKTKMALRKYYTEEALSNLRKMSNAKLREAMRIVEVMLPFAYQHDAKLFWLLVLKGVRWSVKYGVCGQTPICFAALGSFPPFQSLDMRQATALGKASLRLLHRFGASDYPSMVLFLVHSQILNWTMEPAVIQRHLEMTHRLSMEAGDALSACCSLAGAYATSFESGRTSLEDLEALGEIFGRRMKENNCDFVAAIHMANWQVVLNLRGDSHDICELTGRAMNQDEALQSARASRNELLEFMVLSRQLILCYFTGEHSRADELRQRSDSAMRSVASSPMVVAHVAYAALNSLALCASYSSSAVRKNPHYKTAGKLYKKLNSWQNDQGYRFAGHLINLVQAEFSRVNGKDNLAEQNFLKAIQAVGKRGNLRDKGLAHELAGRFFLRDRKQQECASEHFDRAVKSFHAWGAVPLVNKILEKYGEVLARHKKASDLTVQLLSEHNHASNVV